LIRKKFSIKKVGHAGTLDPMATGVLVILVGGYTKSSQSFLNEDKEYEGTLTLGARSDTQDACGKITPSGMEVNFDYTELKKAFDEFAGDIEQRPPMYSAVRYNGKKLYELARKGVSVEVRPRKVVIKRLEITGILIPQVSFYVTCSKGTYIRRLAADIGDRLGCGAYLSRLSRTRSGRFTIGQASSVDELKDFTSADLEKRLIVGDV